jgi:hypothetical protein
MGYIQILLLMAVADVFGKTVNLGICTMEMLMVNIVDNSAHPNAIILVPSLLLFQMVEK